MVILGGRSLSFDRKSLNYICARITGNAILQRKIWGPYKKFEKREEAGIPKQYKISNINLESLGYCWSPYTT